MDLESEQASRVLHPRSDGHPRVHRVGLGAGSEARHLELEDEPVQRDIHQQLYRRYDVLFGTSYTGTRLDRRQHRGWGDLERPRDADPGQHLPEIARPLPGRHAARRVRPAPPGSARRSGVGARPIIRRGSPTARPSGRARSPLRGIRRRSRSRSTTPTAMPCSIRTSPR